MGLRVTACMTEPETARAAPAKIPKTVRGIRAWTTEASKESEAKMKKTAEYGLKAYGFGTVATDRSAQNSRLRIHSRTVMVNRRFFIEFAPGLQITVTDTHQSHME